MIFLFFYYYFFLITEIPRSHKFLKLNIVNTVTTQSTTTTITSTFSTDFGSNIGYDEPFANDDVIVTNNTPISTYTQPTNNNNFSQNKNIYSSSYQG